MTRTSLTRKAKDLANMLISDQAIDHDISEDVWASNNRIDEQPTKVVQSVNLEISGFINNLNNSSETLHYINAQKTNIMKLTKAKMFEFFLGILKNTYKLTKSPTLNIVDVVRSGKRQRSSSYIVSTPKRSHLDMVRTCSICCKRIVIQYEEYYQNFVDHATISIYYGHQNFQ